MTWMIQGMILVEARTAPVRKKMEMRMKMKKMKMLI
jgi:hypothetical protein